MKKLLLITCLLTLGLLPHAQNVSISVVPDKYSIVIGEQFHLVVQTTVPVKGTFDPFEIDSIAHIEILNQEKPDTAENGMKYTIRQSFTVTSWDSGVWQIPAFTYYNQRSKPFTLRVGFSPFDPKQDYHDIKEIVEVEKAANTTWYWYLLGLLLLIVLAILLFPSGKKQTEPAAKKTISAPDNYKSAMQALENLKTKMDSLPAKAFYTELKDTLRTYLKLKISSDPYTTSSSILVKTIAGMDIPAGIKEDTAAVLLNADLAKFARYEAGPDEKTDSIETVKKLINAIENKA